MTAGPADWHAIDGAEVARRLKVDPGRGLDTAEAARRLAESGPNRLPEQAGPSRIRMFLGQFTNLLVALLLVAAGVAFALGEHVDAIAILAIVALNGVVGYLQEQRAADALAALRRMAAPSARVRRDGRVEIVPAERLVPGDIVTLEAGDRVPADLRLLASSELQAVESALTGESEPVRKEASARPEAGAAVADRRNVVFLGTMIAAGGAEGVVVATAAATEFGRIAELMRGGEEPETPLQVRLRVFGRWLVAGTGTLVGLVFVLGLLRGVAPLEMLLTSISLAVAAVPEGLPAIVTIALALGVKRMARNRAIMRRLSSVETLGGTTVICSDKTGTLTAGRMAVREILPSEASREILWSAAAGSTAHLVRSGEGWETAGDPTEGALLLAALGAGIRREEIDRAEPVDTIRPFDSVRKRMSVIRRSAGGLRSHVKGAPEALLPLCRLSEEERARWTAENNRLAGGGLRVLAVARGRAETPESDLEFLGLVGMQDPPRPEAKAAVAACREAGVRVVMITGDQPATAAAIARELGFDAAPAAVIAGPELEAMDDARLAERVESLSVYARVSPEHKLRIVRAWKSRGAVVAMTGDGVNDAPALKAADIGVAMGLGGTDVAKEASAMIITDDNFATIVSAIAEGRTVFENIRKALLYLLSGNIAEILVMAVAVVAGWPLPLVAIQLLWINLVTDGLPALALVTDPPDADALKRPPRSPGSEIADREFLGWMAASGLMAATVTIAAFLYGLRVKGSLEEARTLAFSTLVVEEVLRAFAFRSRTRVLWEIGLFTNLKLVIVAAAVIGLQTYSHHSPVLERFLHTGPLPWSECLGVLALAAVPVTCLELWKLAIRRLRPSGPSPA